MVPLFYLVRRSYTDYSKKIKKGHDSLDFKDKDIDFETPS